MAQKSKEWEQFLQATEFIDTDSEAVRSFAEKAIGSAATPTEKAIRLYYAVRDQIRYDPYRIDLTRHAFMASTVLNKGYGYCVAKAIVLIAAARSQGIPCRLGLADVRNHLTTDRLRQLMKTDEFIYHGYVELFLNHHWLKATPTFNLELCRRFGVKPLDFDGKSDAMLHAYDAQGNRHMEYIRDHGYFADVPFEQIVAIFRQYYPFYFEQKDFKAGNFEEEARKEKGIP
jgi:transglutaminase-like putative cysteine protease